MLRVLDDLEEARSFFSNKENKFAIAILKDGQYIRADLKPYIDRDWLQKAYVAAIERGVGRYEMSAQKSISTRVTYVRVERKFVEGHMYLHEFTL